VKRPKLKMPKLDKPQFKRPQLKKPQFRGPQLKKPKLRGSRLKMPKVSRPRLGGPEIKAPRFVDDVYRDLRDRRLLPVVGLLLVAIVAVPIAISASSGGGPSATESTAVRPAEAPEAQAAVLAENPILRDYRERLDALKAKNPFKQQFQATDLDETAVQDTSAATQAVGAGAAPTGDVGGGGEVSTGTTSTDTSASAPPSTGGETGAPSGTGASEGEVQFFAFRVDVFYGLDGAVKKVKNVKPLEGLSPVGLFVGATEDAKKAVFMLSSDVVGVPGQGTCAPSPDNCEFLGLEEGDAVEILYQPAGTPQPAVYRLRLEQVRLVPVEKSPYAFEEPDGKSR
jgi:hypothetical protein